MPPASLSSAVCRPFSVFRHKYRDSPEIGGPTRVRPISSSRQPPPSSFSARTRWHMRSAGRAKTQIAPSNSRLATAAWCEACNLPVPTPEEIKELEKKATSLKYHDELYR